MGGSQDSEPFKLYEELTIKAFLAVRGYHEHIMNVISPMLTSSLKCFRFGKGSLERLRNRFVLQKNDFQAAKYMK